MSDYIFGFSALTALAVVVYVWVRFGKSPAIALAALFALALAYTKGRKAGTTEAKADTMKEVIKDAEHREESVKRADDAADRIRIVVSNDPDKLREHDPFERR